ncbi:uncharacterized protein LOC130676440 [Microplitis mediator]|uniref:uncharacterized protein LOC130676440 n=1 Tax=Microplitis mediator TaxID=375433 RepID=UPI0025572CB6|nr:uncharacterized protein LOC130676440 [Microplitis mediator]
MNKSEKINDMEQMRKIVQGTEFKAIKTRLSYVNRLFPQLGPNAECVLFCYVKPQDLKEIIKDENNINDSLAMDTTGSPLSHSFGDDSFNVTIAPTKKNWFRDEEKHIPLDRRTAAELINVAQEKLSADTWTLPVFSLCDPKENDEERGVLIGTVFSDKYFIPIDVSLPAMTSLNHIQNGFSDLMRQHFDLVGSSSLDVDIKITSTYELCGTSYEMIDTREQSTDEFKGYLKVEATWDSLTFLPPPTALSNKLVAEIISGSRASPLCDLWDQIVLLDKYLTMVQKYHEKHLSSRYSVKPLIFPKDFDNSYKQSDDVVMRQLKRLLSGDDPFESDENTEGIQVSEDNDRRTKLIEFIEELPRRDNLDFTDKFWQIIRAADNYVLITDCVYAIFEAMVEKNFKPQFNSTEDTRFAGMVSELDSEHKKFSLHAGSISLELVIDMGIEKISRDYLYLLSNMSLLEMSDLQKLITNVSSDEFKLDNYRNKLKALAQVHISLEFLQLIQSQIDCRCEVSHSIFETIFKKYSGPNSPLKFSYLEKPNVYTISMPAPMQIISEITTKEPFSWMSSLTSENKNEKWTTINCYSRIPMFPPNIYVPGELEKGQMELGDTYYVTSAEIRYMRFG